MFRPNHPGHYETVLAYLGTGTARQECDTDYIPGLGACSESYDLPVGSVILRLSIWDGPPSGADRVTTILNGDSLASPTSVDGASGVVQTFSAAAIRPSAMAMMVTIQSPSDESVAYQLEFFEDAADQAALQPAIDDLVRTITVS